MTSSKMKNKKIKMVIKKNRERKKTMRLTRTNQRMRSLQKIQTTRISRWIEMS